MATVVNDRDVLLQQAAARVVPVEDPNAIIIEGYTGILLAKDISMFFWNYNRLTPYPISPERMVLTASLRGIPNNAQVTWSSNRVTLTDTPDPMVKTVEAASYSYPATGEYYQPGVHYPMGDVSVSVSYGGQTFTATIGVSTFLG